MIDANPALAAYFLQNEQANPDILAFITPIAPTSTVAVSLATDLTATPRPAETETAVATPSLVAEAAEPSPYTGWIVFGFGEGTGREIVTMNPATRTWRQITYNDVNDEDPSFSPDNWQVVYASNRSQGGWELYTYDLGKDTERQLTAFDGQARFPVWSPVPGDTRILFEGRTFEPEDAINIWMYDLASGKIEQLTQGGADSRPGWSPDGRHILFGRATKDTTGDGRITVNDALDIFSLELASRSEENLTGSTDFDDFNFAWSPDGIGIAFTSVRRDITGDGIMNLDDSQDLFILRLEGRDELRLDLEGKMTYSPSWSPDSRFILVLVADNAGLTQIWRYDTVNGNFIPVTQPGLYFHPSYSNAGVVSP
jgi:Tol biopolymer transport system component